MSQASATKAGVTAPMPFYVMMSTLCLGVAVLGFMPSFFLPLVQGGFVRPPIFFIHGLLFFGWTLFFCAQTWLAAKGRTLAHREWGVLGAAFAAAMAFSVIAVVTTRLNQTPPIPAGPGSASFAWVDVSGMLFFLTCLALAFARTRQPEVHKRLMLLGTLSLLNAPIARWSGVLFGDHQGPPGSFLEATWFNLVAIGLMLIPILNDARATRRISPVYLVGVPIYAVMNLTVPLVWNTPAWLSVANAIRHIAG